MGPEVLGILLIIAFPVFFFWRWIFAKRITKPSKRAWLIGCATVVTTPLVYVGVIVAIVLAISYYPKKDFDKKAWTADKEHRYEMSRDIIDSEMLIGKTKQQVANVLGMGYNKMEDNYWAYDLGFVPALFNIDPDVLDITFENGRVIKVDKHTS